MKYIFLFIAGYFVISCVESFVKSRCTPSLSWSQQELVNECGAPDDVGFVESSAIGELTEYTYNRPNKKTMLIYLQRGRVESISGLN